MCELTTECTSLNLSLASDLHDFDDFPVPPIWNANHLKEHTRKIVKRTAETRKSLCSKSQAQSKEISEPETKTVALKKKCSPRLLHSEAKSFSNISTTRSKKSGTPFYIPLLRFAAINRKDACFAAENPGILYDTSNQRKTLFPRRYFNNQLALSVDEDAMSHTSVNVATTKTIEDPCPVSNGASVWKDVFERNSVKSLKSRKRRSKKKTASTFTQTSNVERTEPKSTDSPAREVITARNGHIICEKMLDRQKEIKCNIQKFPSLSILPERKIQKVVSISIVPDSEKTRKPQKDKEDNVGYFECKHEQLQDDYSCDGTDYRFNNQSPQMIEPLKVLRTNISPNSNVLSRQKKFWNSHHKKQPRKRFNCPQMNFVSSSISSDDDVENILKNAFSSMEKTPEKPINAGCRIVKDANVQTDAVRFLTASGCLVDKATSFDKTYATESHNIEEEKVKNAENVEVLRENSDDDLIIKIFEKIKNDPCVKISKSQESLRKTKEKQSLICNLNKTFLVEHEPSDNHNETDHSTNITEKSMPENSKYTHQRLQNEFENFSIKCDDDFEVTDYSHLVEENPEFSKTINRIRSSARRRNNNNLLGSERTALKNHSLNDDEIQKAVKIFLKSLYEDREGNEIEENKSGLKSDVVLPELLCAGWSSYDCSFSSIDRFSTEEFSTSSNQSHKRKLAGSSSKLPYYWKELNQPHRRKNQNKTSMDILISSNGENSKTDSCSLSEGEIRSFGEI